MHRIVQSSCLDPTINLAIEEALVEKHEKGQTTLYLWQNDCTVAIGRNQNPWKECNVFLLESMGGRLVRRLSGGGAVFHDRGNLNFTFISDWVDGRVRQNLEFLIAVLRKLGAAAEISGKNDILVSGYKISGNASYIDKDVLCHHGTLLIETGLRMLNEILTPLQMNIVSKGVDSIRSRVANLNNLIGLMTVDIIKNALVSEFKRRYTVEDNSTIESVIIDNESLWSDCSYPFLSDLLRHVQNMKSRYSSWNWTYGESPKFKATFYFNYKAERVNLALDIENGKVCSTRFLDNEMDIDLFQGVASRLIGMRFDQRKLIKLINDFQFETRNDLEKITAEHSTEYQMTKCLE